MDKHLVLYQCKPLYVQLHIVHVLCVNLPHHILEHVRQWEFPIYNAWARWALLRVSFIP